MIPSRPHDFDRRQLHRLATRVLEITKNVGPLNPALNWTDPSDVAYLTLTARALAKASLEHFDNRELDSAVAETRALEETNAKLRAKLERRDEFESRHSELSDRVSVLEDRKRSLADWIDGDKFLPIDPPLSPIEVALMAIHKKEEGTSQ